MPSRVATVGTVASALLIAASAASPADAQQFRRHCGDGARIAADAVGGLVAGALVGGALAGPRYVDPVYVGPPLGDEPCPRVRQPIYDGAGRFAGYRVLPPC